MKHYNQKFETRYNKRFVQSLLYSLSNVRGNALILCGPALLSHLHDFKTIAASSKSKCIIYELNKTTYLKNKYDLINLKNYPYKVELNLDNIINAKIQRFVDFDACANIDTLENEIKILYSNMLKFNNNKYKNIIITCSLRGSDKEYTINKLCNIFNIKNKFNKTDIKLGSTSRLYEQINKNTKIRHFGYRDGSPMLSFSYQWK